jgi:hypothetical protein
MAKMTSLPNIKEAHERHNQAEGEEGDGERAGDEGHPHRRAADRARPAELRHSDEEEALDAKEYEQRDDEEDGFEAHLGIEPDRAGDEQGVGAEEDEAQVIEGNAPARRRGLG